MMILIKAIIMTLGLGFVILHAQERVDHSSHNCASHHNGIRSASIQKIAKKEVKRLVSEKKIAKSWKSVEVSKIGKTHHSYIDDWVVVFENSKIKKRSRQKLYIFISKKGNVMGVNYSGK